MSKRKATPKLETVSEQIRRHVRECSLSAYAIAKAAAIDESALSRFLSGERGLSAKALDRLGALLDFEVVRHGPHD
jgi:plasmid maintenance system antidote protein VapI